MRLISTNVHGFLDYLIGSFLIASPWIINFQRAVAETWIPLIFGVITLILSLITDNETGLWRVVSMRTHLNIHFFIGTFLVASAWMPGAGKNFYLLIVYGFAELIILLFSAREPSDKTRSASKNSLSSWRE